MSKRDWPKILQRYVDEFKPTPEHQPRRVRRRYNGEEVMLWSGFLHVDDVQGYAENIRLRHYLERWRQQRGDPKLVPASEDIYEIMVEADRDERREEKKPFHIERMAYNIVRNGVQEPIIVFYDEEGPGELWDGNRRFYGTYHIMSDKQFAKAREQAQWLPALVVSPQGSPEKDARIKHNIITECNFVDKEHIPWPAYVKAEQIYRQYQKRIAKDPDDPTLRVAVKKELAEHFGLKGWRVVDRWIKMYDLAAEFKEFHEEEHARSEVEVDLKVQEKFEYFDELSKPGPWGAMKEDPDGRDEVFSWLWEDKFKSFSDVRWIPKILTDPEARRRARQDPDVKEAIAAVIRNDPTNIKDREAADAKIRHFAEWLDTFRRQDYVKLSEVGDALHHLQGILGDVVKILSGLTGSNGPSPRDARILRIKSPRKRKKGKSKA